MLKLKEIIPIVLIIIATFILILDNRGILDQLSEVLKKIETTKNVVYLTDIGINQRIEREDNLKNFYLRFFDRWDLVKKIINSSLLHEIPVHLALAIPQIETGYDPNAINENKDGSFDVGLFQLNTKTFPNESIESLLDVNNNISLAMRHMKDVYDKFEYWPRVVFMYNMGYRYNDKGWRYSMLIYGFKDILDEAFCEEF